MSDVRGNAHVESTEKVSGIIGMMNSLGYHKTHSRRTLARLFVETDRHLRAEEIYQMVRGEGISLTTVYRCLDIFKKIGIIDEITIQGNKAYALEVRECLSLHQHQDKDSKTNQWQSV